MVGGASDFRVSELEQEVARLRAEIEQRNTEENVVGESVFTGVKYFSMRSDVDRGDRKSIYQSGQQ
jgi:hypothetical protein